MQRMQMNSTALSWVRYSPRTRILQVALATGTRYDYYGVPLCIYRDLLSAESQGGFYNRYIRNGFTFGKVTKSKAASEN